MKVAANGSGVLQGFDIFTADGTKIIDKATGLTDAAITVVAQATGSAVSTVSKTTNTETASDAQKITNGSTEQDVTLKISKDGDGMQGFDTGTVANAINDIPSQIIVKLLKSSNSDLSSPTTLATRTLNRATQTTNNGFKFQNNSAYRDSSVGMRATQSGFKNRDKVDGRSKEK